MRFLLFNSHIIRYPHNKKNVIYIYRKVIVRYEADSWTKCNESRKWVFLGEGRGRRKERRVEKELEPSAILRLCNNLSLTTTTHYWVFIYNVECYGGANLWSCRFIVHMNLWNESHNRAAAFREIFLQKYA